MVTFKCAAWAHVGFLVRGQLALVWYPEEHPPSPGQRVWSDQVACGGHTGREVQRDPLQSSDGWQNFTAGWVVRAPAPAPL